MGGIALHVYPDGATVASSRSPDGRTLRVVGVLCAVDDKGRPMDYVSPRLEMLRTLVLEEDAHAGREANQETYHPG